MLMSVRGEFAICLIHDFTISPYVNRFTDFHQDPVPILSFLFLLLKRCWEFGTLGAGDLCMDVDHPGFWIL